MILLTGLALVVLAAIISVKSFEMVYHAGKYIETVFRVSSHNAGQYITSVANYN